ncbi:hypothetical protein [Parendozoicomonas sp. Alg238-R29]|uniref:hypothetical protein n=1 Tax=Parendozoicomonas sp. Alg238-R29 TaxID=2993446 RepID=UPI00248D75EE|nr:hypothetical protein [Parendozoicomonas sp. Alg238-R29]
MARRADLLISCLMSSFFVSFCLAATLEDTPEQWLSERVEEYQQQSQWWQYGWSGIHGVSAIAQGYEANRTHSKSSERANTVGAVSAALGAGDVLFRSLYPLPEKSQIPGLSDNAFRLKVLAERIEARSSLAGHLEGWLTGFVGGLIIAAGHGKESDAWEFFAVTGLVVEAQIWSLPRGAVKDWKSYQRSGQLPRGHVKDERIASVKLAGARAIRHGVEFLWWF